MRKISEKTIIKVLVNLKCLGKMGKCVKGFNREERGYILDELVRRVYLQKEPFEVTLAAKDIIMANLNLCE